MRVAILFSCVVLATDSVWANPKGLQVVSGSATATQKGNTLQIKVSQGALLKWSSFNIGPGQTTIFKQPSTTSIVFNQIGSANPSKIFGSLEANGIVVLENLHGFYFGPNAMVKAGGLVVTTAAVNPWSAGGGPGWSFDGPPTAAPIVNYGSLETAKGGSIYLIGKQIENKGTISAPGGNVGLLAGQEVLLSERPDGLSLSEPVKLPAGSVDNSGNILADAGQVLLQAQTVNNSGSIQANSVRQKNGVIELYASQDLQLASSSVIEANGDETGNSGGGKIVVKSDGTFGDAAGSQLSATGGAGGGNGGSVEISAPEFMSLDSRVEAGAQSGWKEGSFSLDPENIVLGNFSSGSTSAGTSGVISATGTTGTVNVDVGSAFQNIDADILLQASGNITLNPGVTWNLSATTGKTTGQMTLEAGGNITLGAAQNAAAIISDANNWSVTLDAGFNFAAGSGVIPGTGTVTLFSGSGGVGSSIQLASGNINVLAGSGVTVGNGAMVTGIANGVVMANGGGNINVQAISGNVNTGTGTGGFVFGSTGPGYAVSPTLGGISTAAGGNVTIEAGGNILSALPNSSVNPNDYGSGAFGAAPGNVTLVAGGNVTGHYVVADGVGTIQAQNAGTGALNLALSLIHGAWDVNAANNIFLQEVRNPNGVLNNFGSPKRGGGGTPNPYLFLFNYDPLASVDLDAGNGVTITGTSLPRTPNNSLEGMVFPPTLTIEAGAGGVTLDAFVNLFPSAEGTLEVTTTHGGNLSGFGINISDSSSTQGVNPNSFTMIDPNNNGLFHLSDPNPVLIDVSGSVQNFTLDSPKAVEMFVSGNIVDSTATIKNLHASDTSIISAGGQIIDHSDYVILTLPKGDAPNFSALDLAAALVLDAVTLQPVLNPVGILTIPNPYLNPILEGQPGQFSYDAATGSLKYQGIMTLAVRNALLSMKTPFLDAATINKIYAQSQLEEAHPLAGYVVDGPGALEVRASSIDLGNAGGIVSEGINGHQELGPYTARGADLDISVTGDLSMLASTIESEYGGNVNVQAGGAIDVGSAIVPSTSTQFPLGICSLWQGNISVIAEGDVNVDGSRIAAYDGGNVFVESLGGNVNAGAGGSGSVLVTKPYLTKKGQLAVLQEEIPGSGILATSFPQLAPGEGSGQIGDITVLTPEGSIVASKGGIAQLALTPVAQNGTINLEAGSKNPDGSVAFVGNVNASGSGVVGGQVNISATGSIDGLVVASVGANVTASQNVNATVLSQGAVTVSAGQTVSGTIVGVGSVSVSGTADVAAAFSSSGVSASGAVSGAAVASAPTGSSSTAAAATTQQVNQTTQGNSTVASNGTDDDNDPLKKKKKAQLMEYVGRVTVLLPE